jgi:AraC-like DNA-binding protein
MLVEHPPLFSDENESHYQRMSSLRFSQPSRLWLAASARSQSQRWQDALQPGTVCAHLNFAGEAELMTSGGSTSRLLAGNLVWARGTSRALRMGGRDRHECLTLVFPDVWLRSTLEGLAESLQPTLRRLLTESNRASTIYGRPLHETDRHWAQASMGQHLCEEARKLLDAARLTDFFVNEVFANSAEEDPSQLLTRTERIARERVERAKAEFLKHLDETPTLEAVAAIAGCSPHHLSRTFSQIEGIPLVLWLRRVRIEHAAKLLASGHCNVSEAALEVGYRSLSHFSRAFAEEKGVSPSRWVAHLGSQHLISSSSPK